MLDSVNIGVGDVDEAQSAPGNYNAPLAIHIVWPAASYTTPRDTIRVCSSRSMISSRAPRRNHGQKAESVSFGQLADGRTVARLNGEHAGQPFSETFDPFGGTAARRAPDGRRAEPSRSAGLTRIRPAE